MEMTIFARFHAREGAEAAVVAELSDSVARTRKEPGCLGISAYRSTRDPRLFWIHSRWTDETSFQVHADLPGTQGFIARTEKLIDHPFDATRAEEIP